MPTMKDENSRANLVNKLSSYAPSPVQIVNGAWYGLKTVAIASGVLAVQSPMKTMMFAMMKNGTFLPPTLGPSPALLPVVQAFYKGTNISGAGLRTAYMGRRPKGQVLVKRKELLQH